MACRNEGQVSARVLIVFRWDDRWDLVVRIVHFIWVQRRQFNESVYVDRDRVNVRYVCVEAFRVMAVD